MVAMQFEQIKQEILKRLEREMGEKRREHSLRVGQVAGELARKHGLDEDKAELAGLVHDIAKEFSEEQNRAYIEKYGLGQELLEPENKNFVHAEVGAEVAREMGCDEEIAEAVRLHTLPKVGMSKFDQVIFLADKFGRRDLPAELEPIKAEAFENLDAAMIDFLHAQAKELERRGIEPNPRAQKYIEQIRRNDGKTESGG